MLLNPFPCSIQELAHRSTYDVNHFTTQGRFDNLPPSRGKQGALKRRLKRRTDNTCLNEDHQLAWITHTQKITFGGTTWINLSPESRVTSIAILASCLTMLRFFHVFNRVSSPAYLDSAKLFMLLHVNFCLKQNQSRGKANHRASLKLKIMHQTPKLTKGKSLYAFPLFQEWCFHTAAAEFSRCCADVPDVILG